MEAVGLTLPDGPNHLALDGIRQVAPVDSISILTTAPGSVDQTHSGPRAVQFL
jgi:hypothetical protein